MWTRQEFINGLMRMGCDSTSKIKDKLPSLQADLIDLNQFKKFYSFAFDVSRAEGQKVLDLDTAITLWRMTLADKFTHMDAWASFLETEFKKSITVPRPLPTIPCRFLSFLPANAGASRPSFVLQHGLFCAAERREGPRTIWTGAFRIHQLCRLSWHQKEDRPKPVC